MNNKYTLVVTFLWMLVFAFLGSPKLQAQIPCVSSNTTLSSQAEVDAFIAPLTGSGATCNAIIGNLTLKGDITDISGLNFLTTVTGRLNLTDLTDLTSLQGLENIDSIGQRLRIENANQLTSLQGLNGAAIGTLDNNLIIRNNDLLTDISALSGLTTIGNNITIVDNAVLTSLNGLETITSFGNNTTITGNTLLTDCSATCNLITFNESRVSFNNPLTSCSSTNEVAIYCTPTGTCPTQNYRLTSQNEVDAFVTSLSNCPTVAGDLTIIGNDIVDLSGLSFLTSIVGDLFISENSNLTSLQGLENIVSIGGKLDINDNDNLTSLQGLDGTVLQSIGANLIITLNDALTDISALEGLATVGNNINISDNSVLTSLAGLGSITSLGNNVTISNNTLLVDCSAACGLIAININKVTFNNPLATCVNTLAVNDLCAAAAVVENTAATCADGVDNDGDGNIDGADQECICLATPATCCDNFIINGGATDSYIDQPTGSIVIVPTGGSGDVLDIILTSTDATFQRTATGFLADNLAIGDYTITVIDTVINCQSTLTYSVGLDPTTPNCPTQGIAITNLPQTACYNEVPSPAIISVPAGYQVANVTLQVDGGAIVPATDAGGGLYEAPISFGRNQGGDREVIANITYTNGCTDNISETIAVQSSFARYSFSADGRTVTFSANQSNAALITTYTYDFGDGSTPVTSTTGVVTYTYPLPGTYEVSLTTTGTCRNNIFRRTLEITDSQFCNNFQAEVQVTNATNNLSNGIIEIIPNASLDIPNLVINSNVSFDLVGNSLIAADLAAGNYSITLSDASGLCSETYAITIENDIDCSGLVLNPRLSYNATGAVFRPRATGGTGPYVYSTTTANQVRNDLFRGDCGGGTYDITVTDAVGCSVTETIQTEDRSVSGILSYSVEANHIQFAITNQQNIQSISVSSTELPTSIGTDFTTSIPLPGTYNVCFQLTGLCDAIELCTAVIIDVSPTENTPLACMDGIDNDGDGNIDGADQQCACIDVTVSGPQNCCANFTSTVTVTDSYVDQSTGRIKLVPSGGSGKIEDIVVTSPNATFAIIGDSFVANNLAVGTYTITLTDPLISCETELIVSVGIDAGSPNCPTESISLDFIPQIACVGTVYPSVLNVPTGYAIQTVSVSVDGNNYALTPSTSGTYTFPLSFDANFAGNQEIVASVAYTNGCTNTIAQSILVKASSTSIAIAQDGLQAIITTATTNQEFINSYTYDLGDGTVKTTSSPISFSHLYPIPGAYVVKLTTTGPCGSDMISETIVVEDANFCDDFGVTIDVTDAINGQANGQIILIPSDKVNSSTSGIISNLSFAIVGDVFAANNVAAGTYTIELWDGTLNCSKSYTITVGNQIDCSGFSGIIRRDPQGCFGTYKVVLNGGVAPYQFNWTADGINQSSTFNPSNNYVGNHILTITDARGCTISGSYSVEPLGGSVSALFTVSIGENGIYLSDLSSGDISSIQWTANTPTMPAFDFITLPPPGTYEICMIVRSACGAESVHCETVVIEDTTGPGSTLLPKFLEDFLWITTKTDLQNCTGTVISLYQSGGYQYIYIEDVNGQTLYNSVGDLYCTSGVGFNCLDYYGGALIDQWSCNPVPVIDLDQDGTPSTEDPNDNDPCVPVATLASCNTPPPPPPTTNQLFTNYPFLSGLVNVNNCAGTEVTAYRSAGGYEYFLVETANSAVLYNATGVAYCYPSPTYDCIANYQLVEVFDSWQCGGSVAVDADQDGFPSTTDPDDLDPCNPVATAAGCQSVSQPQIFTDYSWLETTTGITASNCAGANITVYQSGVYVYIYVVNGNSYTLYNEAGQVYCSGSPTYDCPSLYGFTDILATWSCGVTTPPTPPAPQDADNDGTPSTSDPDDNNPCVPVAIAGCQTTSQPQIFTDYSWLETTTGITASNCAGASITVYQSGIYSYVYVVSGNSYTMYNEAGQVYCSGSPTYDCPSLYGFTDVVANWSCGATTAPPATQDADNDGTPSTSDPDDNNPCVPVAIAGCQTTSQPQIFTDYSWLETTTGITASNCAGASITVYQSGIYTYIYVVTGNSYTMYNEAGQVYCSGSPTYDCPSLYGFTDIIATWACGATTVPPTPTVVDNDNDGVAEDSDPDDWNPCVPNNTSTACSDGTTLLDIFNTYDWLGQHVNPFNCSTEKVMVFVSGAYKYINVVTPTSTILYTETGQVYCTSGPGYDCPSLYGFTQVESTWTCGQSLDDAAASSRNTELQLENKVPTSDLTFKAYPNPTVGPVTLELPTLEEATQIRVVDLQGRVLEQLEVAANHTGNMNVDLSGKESGIYLIQWIAKDTVHTERVIVR